MYVSAFQVATEALNDGPVPVGIAVATPSDPVLFQDQASAFEVTSMSMVARTNTFAVNVTAVVVAPRARSATGAVMFIVASTHVESGAQNWPEAHVNPEVVHTPLEQKSPQVKGLLSSHATLFGVLMHPLPHEPESVVHGFSSSQLEHGIST